MRWLRALPFSIGLVLCRSCKGTVLPHGRVERPWRRRDDNPWQIPSTHLALSPPWAILGCTTVAAILRGLTHEPVRRALYFWHSAAPIIVHYRWTQWWLDHRHAGDHQRAHRDAVYGRLHRRYAEPTLNLILHLKGLYVKIGQVLSSRPDFVPIEYVRAFSIVQDAIPQWPVQQIRGIIEKSFQDELSCTLGDVLESIDPVALGSASIGQVHEAIMHSGESVAVKVMHPSAEDRFRCDFQVFRWLCRVALPGWKGLLDELERRIMTEFDYRHEARSMECVRNNHARSRYQRHTVVPQPHLDLCCKHVLVMEMLRGKKLIDYIEDGVIEAVGDQEQARELMRQRQEQAMMGDDGNTRDLLTALSLRTKLKLLRLQRKCHHYVDLLLDVHGRQIFVDGAFNGDPHFGNVLVLDDGRLGLIDYGQTKMLEDDERLAFAQVVVALSHESDDDMVANAMRQAGFAVRNNNDAATLTKYGTLFFDSDLESSRLGYATPQLYFASLMATNPLTDIPDSAIFVARTSFLFRGMGHAIGAGPLRTSKRWQKHAEEALALTDHRAYKMNG